MPNRELRIAARVSPLHTACVSHQPWRARWLPAPLSRAETGLWSEKTTVCRIFSCQRIGEAFSLAAGGPSAPLRAPARQPLSKLVGSRRSQQTAPYTARPASLARTFDCYISVTEVQAEVQSIVLPLAGSTHRGPPSPYRATARQPSSSRSAPAGWPAEPKPAHAAAPAGEGWWA